MKTNNIILFTLLLAFTATTQAQDKCFVGLTASSGGAFDLSGGATLDSHWTIGAGLQYRHSVQKETTPFGTSSQGGTITLIEQGTSGEWTCAPFVRYTRALFSRWSAFGQLRTPVTRGYHSYFKNISDRLGPLESKTFAVGAKLGPGVQFRFAERWVLTADMALLGYAYGRVDKGPA